MDPTLFLKAALLFAVSTVPPVCVQGRVCSMGNYYNEQRSGIVWGMDADGTCTSIVLGGVSNQMNDNVDLYCEPFLDAPNVTENQGQQLPSDNMEIDESTDTPAPVNKVTVEKIPFKYTHITSTIDNTKDSSTIFYDTTRMNTAEELAVTSSEFSTARKSAAFKLTTLTATANPTKLMTSSYESEETPPTTALQTNGKPTVSIGQLLSSSTVSLTDDSNATTGRPSQTMTVTSEAGTNSEASPLVSGTDRTEWLTELQTQLYSSLNTNDVILTDVDDDDAKSSTTSESTKTAYQHHSTEMSYLTSTLTSQSTDIATASTSNLDLFRSEPISSVEASTPLEIVSTEEYIETVRKSTTMATNSVPADDSSTSFITVPETLGTDNNQITTAESREACPSDWVLGLDGSCYYMSVETGSWDEAHSACSSIGAHLVKIENSQENDFIGSVILNLEAHFYIGLTDKDTEGTWIWEDGSEATFSVLTNGDKEQKDCARIKYNDSSWQPVTCTSSNAWICEIN